MFDDPSAEIDELTGIIKHDIQALNDGIAELQRVSARRGDGANKQSAEHSHTVVDSLRTRLKDATAEFKEVTWAGLGRGWSEGGGGRGPTRLRPARQRPARPTPRRF
jgi:hypothetical protein